MKTLTGLNGQAVIKSDQDRSMLVTLKLKMDATTSLFNVGFLCCVHRKVSSGRDL